MVRKLLNHIKVILSEQNKSNKFGYALIFKCCHPDITGLIHPKNNNFLATEEVWLAEKVL